MKLFSNSLRAVLALTLGLSFPVSAGATAAQSAIGYYSTSCGNAPSPCFIQYGATVPVSGSLTPAGTQDVNTKQVNGATVNVGEGAAGTGTQRVSISTGSGLSTAANQTATQTPVAPASATATVGQLGGGQYNSTPPTFTNGQQGSIQLTSKGDNKGCVTIGDGVCLPFGPAQVYQAYTYTNITTKTNTSICVAACVLVSISINKTGTADTLTVKDSSAADCSGGTTIGTITVIATDVNRTFYAQTVNGLCITSGGTTAGDYTVMSR